MALIASRCFIFFSGGDILLELLAARRCWTRARDDRVVIDAMDRAGIEEMEGADRKDDAVRRDRTGVRMDILLWCELDR